MGQGAQYRPNAGACLLWLLLATCGTADAGILYRCSGGDAPVRWQAQPCEPGERQRTLEYEPEPVRAESAKPPAPARPAAQPRAVPRPASSSRTRRDPAKERAAEACRKATAVARERSDDQGRRLPLRVIRQRERQAERICAG